MTPLAVVAVLACVVFASCGAVVAFGITLAARSVSIEDTLGTLRQLSQRTVVYASDGVSVIGVLGEENRSNAALREVPQVLVDAVVDTEDATFFTNPGVDVAAVTRSAVRNVLSGEVREGGSTITQQLAKNRLLSSEQDLERKLGEISLALQLTERYSKKQILTEYLNTVYFGQGAYGVKTAAERFFLVWDEMSGLPRGKQLHELTLAEAALLAGLIASPEGNNPFRYPERAIARRAVVLDRMVARGSVTARDAEAAKREPLPTVTPPADLRPRNYLADEVQRALLADPRLGETAEERRKAVLRGGLHVYSTFDLTAQGRAEAAMAEVLPDQPPFTASLVAIEPATGAVRAMVGGPDYGTLQYNLATHRPGRQAGSTYKIVTLAAALEAGYSPDDVLDGSSPCTVVRPPFPPWETRNAEPGGGRTTLRGATVGSVNCAYAHLIASLGPRAVVDMAKRMGVTQDVPGYLSITLGTHETTPLEMATITATLANRGVRQAPTFVSKVIDSNGDVLIDDSARAGVRALAADVADCATDILRGVVQSGTGTRAAIAGRDVAGKTGTTDNKADAWFVGFTPQLATAVWMGATTGTVPMTSVGGTTVFGGTYPARIWQSFMAAQLADQPPAPFAPAGPVCSRPGGAVVGNQRLTAPPPPRPGPRPETQSEPDPAPSAAPMPAPENPPPATEPAPAPAPGSDGPGRSGREPPGHARRG